MTHQKLSPVQRQLLNAAKLALVALRSGRGSRNAIRLLETAIERAEFHSAVDRYLAKGYNKARIARILNTSCQRVCQKARKMHDEHGLSARAHKALEYSGLTTKEQVRAALETGLLKTNRGVGRMTLAELALWASFPNP